LSRILIALLLLSLAQRILFALACLLSRRRSTASGRLPEVQILVAARNEEAALPRLLESLDRIDYDPEKLSFVLTSDGSTDRTASLMAAWCSQRPRATAIPLSHHVGKASALQTAFKQAPGAELTAIYDADTQPAPNALRVLAEAFADLRVGAATGPVAPSNPAVNMVTRYAALELWVFHQVTQAARDFLSLNPPVIGAQSVYRTAALAGIGGFPQNTGLSEDIETSFALQERGWRTTFRREAVVKTDVPETIGDYCRQRQRWTRGLQQAVWRAPGPSAVFAATGYLDRLVFLCLAVAVAIGAVSWWLPTLYFLGPALNVGLALRCARVPSGFIFFLNCLPMFAVDLGVTVSGTVMSLNPLALNRHTRW
jgi:cellulose synthase/poly-beta-1,6-N-acetylglucosamine synthase-like glycosyltransferase